MKQLGMIVVAVTFALVGCGGEGAPPSSGVDEMKAITTLDAGEVTTLCTWAVDVQGGPGHITMCGGGITITAPSQQECEMEYAALPAACSTVTVAELEACVNEQGANPCTAFSSPKCQKFLSCSLGG